MFTIKYIFKILVPLMLVLGFQVQSATALKSSNQISDSYRFNNNSDQKFLSNRGGIPSGLLTVDETDIGGAGGTAIANFSSYFSGSASNYSFSLSGFNVSSGIYAIDNTDSSNADGDGIGQGNEILLNLSGNIVIGSVNGIDYFTIEPNTITGDVEFNLLTAVWSDDDINPNESMSLFTVSASDLTLNAFITSTASIETLDLGQGTLVIEDDGPSIIATGGVNPILTVDETDLAINASADFASIFFKTYGADGAGSADGYNLGISFPGADSGLVDSATGSNVFLFLEGGDVVGRTGISDLVFNIDVDSTTGVVTLDQLRAILDSDPNDPNSSSGLNSNSITLSATISDADGDTDSATVNVGASFIFKDDGPSIGAPTSISDLSDSEFADIQLAVDESAGVQANPTDTVADRQSNADFSNLFNAVDYGTDGPGSINYDLTATDNFGIPNNGLGSGLYAVDNTDTTNGDGDAVGQGAEILLFNTNVGDIEGRAVSSTGNLYFTVSNNGSEIILTQSSLNIWHDNTSSNNETVLLNGLGGDGNTIYNINLVQTITDADGDTDSASLNLIEAHGSGNDSEYVFNFLDDAPSIGAIGTLNATAVLDESQLPANGDGIYQATIDLASVFGANSYGTDGPGSSSYAVEFDNTAGAGSGLFILDNASPDGKGASIDLVDQGNKTVKGIVNGTSMEVFTLSVDANGLLTFEYSNQIDPTNIWHGDTFDNDDSESINTITANQLVVTKSATDADGDTASQLLDIGQSALRFEDDGPTAYDDQICTDSSETLNITFALDVSGSMDSMQSNGMTSMSIMKNSMLAVINNFEDQDINMTLVPFAGNQSGDQSNPVTAINLGTYNLANTTDFANIINEINSLQVGDPVDGQYTNYENALDIAETVISNSLASGVEQTLFFISGSEPNRGDTNISDWVIYRESVNIGIYAVTIGDINITSLELVDNAGDSVIQVLNPSDLEAILLDFIPVMSAMGSVLDGSLTTGGIADTYGTDGAGQPISFEHDGIVYSAASFGTSHTITTADGGTFTFYFEGVGIKSAGDFEYTASTGSSIDITEVFTYTLQDADGDRAGANLEICVDHKGVPGALIVPTIVIDEDDLPTGNNDVATGDDNPINVTGALTPDYGTDGVGSLQLVAGNAPSGFSYDVSNAGLLLTIMQGTTEIANMTLTESSATSGEYSYQAILLAPITHQINGTEDNIDFPMGIRVLDGNGTSVTSDFSLSIDDDLPVLASSSVMAVVEEEQLTGGNEDTTDVNGLDTDTNGDANSVTNIVTGSLASLVDSGADGYGGFSFGIVDPLAFVQSLGLTSNGLTINDATLSNGVLTAKAGPNDIFSLEIESTGGYAFILLDQLDHHAIINADNSEDILSIDFSAAIKFTDGDGDSVILNAGMFQIRVIDDVPIVDGDLSFGLVTQNDFNGIQLSVDESADQQVNPEDTIFDRVSASDYTNYFSATAVNTSGNLAIGFGADGPGGLNASTAQITLTDANGIPIITGAHSGLFGLVETTPSSGEFVKGSEIQLFSSANGIEGRIGSDVYFTIGNTGADVMLAQSAGFNLWHPDVSNQDDVVSLAGISDGSASITYSINLEGNIVDADGDSAGASLSLTQAVNVEGTSQYIFNFGDDAPSVDGDLSFGLLTQNNFDSIQLSVDESAGQQVNPEDNVSDRVSASDFANYFSITAVNTSGDLAIDIGTDGLGGLDLSTANLTLTDANGIPITTGASSGLFGMVELAPASCEFVRGNEIQLFSNANGIEGHADGNVYFTISQSGTDVTLTQSTGFNIWHPDDSNKDNVVSLAGVSDGSALVTYSINLLADVADADGDSTEASLSLTQAVDVDGNPQYIFNFGDGGFDFCNSEPVIVNDVYTAFEDITLVANDADGSVAGVNNDGVLVNDSDVDGETLTIVNPGMFLATGLGGEITITINGTFTYVPPANVSGQDVLNFDVTDGVNTVDSSLTIDVLPVNDVPSFSILGDVLNADLNPDLVNTTLTISQFAFDIDVGAEDENSQSLQFMPLIIADPYSILTANGVYLSNTGELTLNFTSNIGIAIIRLSLQDDGLTTNGGENTSKSVDFVVSFRDLIFVDGFEEPQVN